MLDKGTIISFPLFSFLWTSIRSQYSCPSVLAPLRGRGMSYKAIRININIDSVKLINNTGVLEQLPFYAPEVRVKP